MSTVIQFCPTLGTPCGIATYTEMLASAQGMDAVRTIEELGNRKPLYLHVQHEFGILNTESMKQIADECEKRGVKLVVTMHTVIPQPSVRGYIRFRIIRFIRRLYRVLFSWKRLLRFVVRRGKIFLWKIDNFFERKLRAWRYAKSRVPFLKKAVRLCTWVKPQPLDPDIFKGKRWMWTEKNPDYGFSAFREFRNCQEEIIRSAHSIVVHNEEARSALESMGATSVQVVPHGILNAEKSDRLLSDTDGRLHIGLFGFLKSNKGIREVIDACRIAKRGITLHLFTSTAHEDQHDEYYEDILLTMTKNPWINLHTEYLELEEVVHRLSEMNLNIWYADPPGGISTSGSLRQLMAALRPIIASKNIMVTDVEDALILVPPRSPYALARTIENWNEEKLDRMQEYCRIQSWEKVKAEYGEDETMIKETISKSHAALTESESSLQPAQG